MRTRPLTATTAALVLLVLVTSATGQPLPDQGVPPAHGVLYAMEPLSGALVARTRDVSVRLVAEQGDDESAPYVLHVETREGQSARYPWPEGEPRQPDEIYLLYGYACDRRLIDIVVRSAPPKYADIPSFHYIRYLVDGETLELAALVPTDPSVRAALGVLPIQSVSVGGRWPVFSVTCDGAGVEGVAVQDGY